MKTFRDFLERQDKFLRTFGFAVTAENRDIFLEDLMELQEGADLLGQEVEMNFLGPVSTEDIDTLEGGNVRTSLSLRELIEEVKQDRIARINLSVNPLDGNVRVTFTYLEAGLEEGRLVEALNDPEVTTGLAERGWVQVTGLGIVADPARVDISGVNTLVLQSGLESSPQLKLVGIQVIENAPTTVAGMLEFIGQFLQKLSGQSSRIGVFFNGETFSKEQAMASLPLVYPPVGSASVLPGDWSDLRNHPQEVAAILAISKETGSLFIYRITRVDWSGKALLVIQA